jgi:hypothetical protein
MMDGAAWRFDARDLEGREIELHDRRHATIGIDARDIAFT